MGDTDATLPGHALDTVTTMDADRFADIVTEHHARLARLAFLLCGDRDTAEDAVADAYVAVWPKYRRGHVDELVPYLRQAVVNQVRRRLRRRILERREEARRRIDAREFATPQRDADDRHVVAGAIAGLPAGQRAVIVLRFYEGLSEAEIARLLGLRPGTVKSRCARALEQLRRTIGETDA